MKVVRTNPTAELVNRTISLTVQGLTQHFEQMSMRGGTHASETKTFLDEASDPPVELHLNYEEVSWEYYTGRHFTVPEFNCN